MRTTKTLCARGKSFRKCSKLQQEASPRRPGEHLRIGRQTAITMNMKGRLGTKCDGDFVFTQLATFLGSLKCLGEPGGSEILNNKTKTQALPQHLRTVETNYITDYFTFSFTIHACKNSERHTKFSKETLREKKPLRRSRYR